MNTYFATYHEDQGGYGFWVTVGAEKKTFNHDYNILKFVPKRYDHWPNEVPHIYKISVDSSNEVQSAISYGESYAT